MKTQGNKEDLISMEKLIETLLNQNVGNRTFNIDLPILSAERQAELDQFVSFLFEPTHPTVH